MGFTKYIVSEGQTLTDVCIEVYGSGDMIMRLLQDNPGISLGQPLAAGQEILVDYALAGTNQVARYFRERGVRVNSGLTLVAIEPPADDTTPPVVITYAPAHLAQEVPISTSIVLTFDEPIQRGAGTAALKKLSDDSTVVSWTAAGTSVSVSGSTLTLSAPSLGFGETYYLVADPGFVRDLSGNPWAGITEDGIYRFSTEGVTLFPAPGQIGVDIDANPYIEVAAPITWGSGTAQIWADDQSPVDGQKFIDVPAGNSALAAISQQPNGRWRVTFFYSQAFLPSLDFVGIYVPAGWIVLGGTDWAGTEFPAASWTWQVAPVGTNFQVVETSVPDGGSTSDRLMWVRTNRKIGYRAGLQNAPVRYSVDGGSLKQPEAVAAPYQGRYDVWAFRIPEADWNSGQLIAIEVQPTIAWNPLYDRGGQVIQSFTYTVNRTVTLPLASINGDTLLAESRDPACAGNFTATVDIDLVGDPVAAFAFTQADFPLNDVQVLLQPYLPAVYDVTLTVTDCVGQATAEAKVLRPLGDPPIAIVDVAGGFILFEVESPAPYSNGAFTAIVTVQDPADAVVFQEDYTQATLPGSISLGSLGLTDGVSYRVTLTVTAPDFQTDQDAEDFTFSDPCAAIVWPSLAGIVASTGDTGTQVQINWVSLDPPPATTTVLDYLQEEFPADWQARFDRLFRPQLISPRISRAAYSALLPAVGGKFTGPYGFETWYLSSTNSSGNGERPRFIQFQNGDTFLVDRSGTWRITVYWVEDSTGQNATGSIFRNVLFNVPPDREDGQPDLDNRLITDTSNSMGEIRVDREGRIIYPRDNEIWAYNILTGKDSPIYSGSLGNVGNPVNERNPGGGDGNSYDPYLVLSHGAKNTNIFLHDPATNEVVWEELVGAPGSYAWVEARYPANGNTTRHFDLPADLDYASVSPDGQYFVAAVTGQGTNLYSRSGQNLGQLISTSNHFDTVWFREDGVYRPAVLVWLTGQANINTGVFTGMYLKDILAIVWDVTTDAETGNRSMSRRVYKLLDWQQQEGPQGGGQASFIGANRDHGYVAIVRNNGADDGQNYIWADQIVEIALNNDTAYGPMLIDEHMALRDNSNVNKQAEVFTGPRSLIDPSYSWMASRGCVIETESNKLFLRRIWDRPSDSVITANINP